MKNFRYRYFILIFLGLFSASLICSKIFYGHMIPSIFISLFFSLILMEIILKYLFRGVKTNSFTLEHAREPFVQGHPYLPFVYKENVFVPMLPRNQYDFMGTDCDFPKIRTNNRGNLNGPNGDRPVLINPKKDLFRVVTLGDSVSANYIRKNDRNYNFSVEIENQLREKGIKKNIEVNNCAIGGYTLIDILVKFMIKDIYEKPNVVVLNHGYSNIRSYLCNQYLSDNTHFRKSFSVGDSRYKIASYLPFKNTFFYKTFFSPWLPSDLKDFLKYVSLDNFDINETWKGFDFFESNLSNLINLCFTNNIKFILCTCPHFLHPGIINSKSHQKFHEGMKIQNELIRKLSKKMSVYLVDNELHVPASEEYFIDSIHLSPLGLEKSAEGISEIIMEL